MNETIICAAIWFKDFDSPMHTVNNIEKGVVLCGYRHGHIFGQFSILTGRKKSGDYGEYVQGFLTSKNRFLDRKEAHKLFVLIGGKPEFKDQLYSEDLY